MTVLHETADCDRVRNAARVARLARLARMNPAKPLLIEIVEHAPEPIQVERKLAEAVPVPAEKENRLKYSRLDDQHKGEPLLAPVPSLDYIKRSVAKAYGVSVLDMESARRTADIVRPRQIAMYLCMTMTRRSLPAVGRAFDGKDHTTVLHARRKIEALRATDPVLDMKVEGIKAVILDTFLGVPSGSPLLQTRKDFPFANAERVAGTEAQVPPPHTDLPHGKTHSEHSGTSS